MLSELTQAVSEVGDLLVKWRQSGLYQSTLKGDQVTSPVDQLAHRALSERLWVINPGLPVISEEDPASLVRQRPHRYWLIDPLDGTASFVDGYPGFVTQAALIQDDRPVLAAIYAPVLKEFYVAERGAGAYRNSHRMHLKSEQIPRTLIDNRKRPEGLARSVYDAFKLTGYVECGSISLKMCRVADGTADIFVKDVVIRDWDLAAPHLVLLEAGGCATDLKGEMFAYSGSYEHDGLIASSSFNLTRRIAQWYSSREQEGVGLR